MKNVSVIIFLVACLFLFAACGPSNDLSGRYLCTAHPNKSLIGQITFDFMEDGVIVKKPLKREGHYKVEGDSVTIEGLEQFELTLTIKENQLVSDDGTIVFEKQ